MNELAYDLFGGCEPESEEILKKRTLTRKATAVAFLETIKDKTTKILINRSKCCVTLEEDGKIICTSRVFKPISTYWGFGDKRKADFAWEEPLCNLLGLKHYDILTKLPFQKQRMQYYTKYLGISPKRFISIYNANMCKAFIPESLSDFTKRTCRMRLGHYDKIAIENINKNKKLIEQCLEDGMENITPFFMFIRTAYKDNEDSVTLLRKKVGKGLWKQFLKNSFTRNKNICITYNNSFDRNSHPLKDLQQIPSGLLCRSRNRSPIGVIAANVIKTHKLITKTETHNKIEHTIDDTLSMYKQLEKPLPKQHTKWTLDKWNKQHEWCIEQINLKRYSKAVFECLEGLQRTYQSSCGKYTATLLDSAYDIRNEGDAMHHCVGSYSDRVKNGNYLVLSIRTKTDDKRSSTLGLYRFSERNKVGVRFSQQYKYCNGIVTDENELSFTDNIMRDLDKQLKQMENYK